MLVPGNPIDSVHMHITPRIESVLSLYLDERRGVQENISLRSREDRAKKHIKIYFLDVDEQ